MDLRKLGTCDQATSHAHRVFQTTSTIQYRSICLQKSTIQFAERDDQILDTYESKRKNLNSNQSFL